MALAYVIERLVLRPLVNQEGVALLMATLGVTYFLDGFGQTLWGSDIYEINLGIRREPVMILDNLFQGGILINRDDVAAAIVAVILVGALALGALALGALAIGALAIGRLKVGKAHIRKLRIDELEVGRLIRVGEGDE